MNRDQDSRHYERIAAAIRYLDRHREAQPGLVELAAEVGLSADHLQRVFTEWAGISPKRFLQVLSRSHARQLLHDSAPTFETALATGLSGGGRLHDLFVDCEGVTPGEVAQLGKGLTIDFGFADTPFGLALIGQSPRGVCHLRFVDGDRAAAEAELAAEWPRATRRHNASGAAEMAVRIFKSGAAANSLQSRPLALWLKGTNFQFQVWQALLHLPPGGVTSYGALARSIGKSGAARAVGSAVGANPVGWLIPCHRVIRETGALGGYRWGLIRKQAMLARESAAPTRLADLARNAINAGKPDDVNYAGSDLPLSASVSPTSERKARASGGITR